MQTHSVSRGMADEGGSQFDTPVSSNSMHAGVIAMGCLTYAYCVLLLLLLPQGQSNEALRGLTRTLDAAAAEAEVSLAPIAKRHAQQAQKQLQQLDQQWTAAAADFERSSRNQQQEQQQGWSRRTQHHHQLKAASSDGGWDD